MPGCFLRCTSSIKDLVIDWVIKKLVKPSLKGFLNEEVKVSHGYKKSIVEDAR